MFRTVAVIGAGPAGLRFARLCLRGGLQVTVEDLLPGNLRRASSALAATGVRLAATIEDAVRDADLVFDTVPDELESKLEMFTLLDRMAPPAAVLLTPTETLSIRDLASCTYRPALCFGLRWTLDEGAAATLVSHDGADRAAEGAVSRLLSQLGAAAVTLERDDAPLP